MVSFFIQMRLSCVCIHKKCFFQIRSIESLSRVLKMVIKNLQNVTKEIVWNALLFRKKLSASSENGNSPIKNNGPSLTEQVSLTDSEQQHYKSCLNTSYGQNFPDCRAIYMGGNMTSPCILNKTAVAFSTSC